MRIAYVTSDEVNLDWAQRWASTCGCEVIAMSPSDSPNGDCDATIYDLDFLLPTYGDEVLSVLLSRPLPCPAAVHSYNLRRHQASKLRARGLVVRRRLERELFISLRREVSRIRAKERRSRMATPAPHRRMT